MLEVDGADEAIRSSSELSLELERDNPPLLRLTGGKISDGGDCGGDTDGL
jgi:hypothetical protein